MIRHLLTGQATRAFGSFCLPLLCFLLLPLGLPAQSGDIAQNPSAEKAAATSVDDSAAKTDPDDASAAANPAPEPDTWMLLGTGTVVLLLLYTRRRTRLTAPRAQPQQ